MSDTAIVEIAQSWLLEQEIEYGTVAKLVVRDRPDVWQISVQQE